MIKQENQNQINVKTTISTTHAATTPKRTVTQIIETKHTSKTTALSMTTTSTTATTSTTKTTTTTVTTITTTTSTSTNPTTSTTKTTTTMKAKTITTATFTKTSKMTKTSSPLTTDATAAGIQNLECVTGWSGFIHTGQCYKHIPSLTTWKGAWTSCQTLSPSANLASIPDKITNDFLTNIATSRFWTGGFKASNGKFAWVNGDQWTGFNSWAPGEPNGELKQYIEVHTESSGSLRPGMWNDTPFNNKLGAMCQYDPGKGNQKFSLS